MDNQFERLETDSSVDFKLIVSEAGRLVEPTDPDIEFRVHARDENAGQILVGSADAVTVGHRTDADVRQAADPNVIYIAVGFEP